MVAGHSGTEIAAALGISQFTVRRHVADILSRTGTKRQVDLVRLLSRVPEEFDAERGLLH
jgi:DNA-binding CsgD family transcriptional regulator